MQQYKYQIHDYLEYRCFFGIFHQAQEYPTLHAIHMLDQYRTPLHHPYPYSKCPFFLRYSRPDPADKTTPYLLSAFQFSHSHPLGLHNFHYNDFNIKEVKRRSRNEFMMYEKNERRINKYEFCKESGAGCVNPNDLVA